MDYYEVLGVAPDSPQDEIRRAYLREARKCHPDKNTDEVNQVETSAAPIVSKEAKSKFQILQKVYSVLSDPEKRSRYDDLGEEIDGDLEDVRITEEDIVSFAKEYFGSDVEKEDLIQNYVRFKGNMAKVFDSQILSEERYDSHRFNDIIQEAIEKGEAKVYKAYESWRQRVLKRKRADPNFNKRCKKSKKSDTKLEDSMALVNAIGDRGKKHMAFVDDLKSRLIGSGPTPYDDITEEEFLQAQSRLLNPRGQTSKAKKPTRKKRK